MACQLSPDTGWIQSTREDFARARAAGLAALSNDSDRPVSHRLRSYYNVATDYAGASFAELTPNEPFAITGVDLHATSLLSVTVRPGATRRLLDPGETRDAVHEALSRLDPKSDLTSVDETTAVAMNAFYVHVKHALSGGHVKNANPWVTASKVCARKRPRLFPVRDAVVCGQLGIGKTAQGDWAMFRELVNDSAVLERLEALPGEVRAAAHGRELILDCVALRLLDAALWTWGQPSMGRP